jgi:hypothetical protein
VQRGSAHREWYANGNSSRRLEASWCRSLLAVEFSILELCPASLRVVEGAKALEARGSVIRGGGFYRPPTPVPLIASLFSCCHHSLSLHLRKVKLTHSLYPRPFRLSSALQSAPISSSALNSPLTPLIALQQTAHSPHHRLISAFSCRKTSNIHLTYPYPAQNPPCRQLATNRVWRSSREVGREMSWRRNGGARTQHSKRCVIFGLVF